MGSLELDTTERLHFHFSLSCIGEGNGNPLQCSCLENSREGKPGWLLSMGSHSVGHDWSDLAARASQVAQMVKNPTAMQETGVRSLGQEDPWRRKWQPNPVFLPRESHGWRSLVGCSPWDRTESDMTERLHFHFSLSCIGEGNGNPVQCSCLENPREGKPGWLLSMGSHRVGHDWSNAAAAAGEFCQRLFLHLLRWYGSYLSIC